MTAFIPILYHTIINGIIVARHYSTNSVSAAALATDAIKLNSTTSLGGSSTSTNFATATNGSLPVTVPAGGRSVLLLFYISVNTNALLDWRIRKDGTTTLASGREPLNATGGWTNTVSAIAIDTAPSAASHTYEFQFARAAGSSTVSITDGHFVVMLI